MKKPIIMFLMFFLYGCSTFSSHNKEYDSLKIRINTLANQVKTNSVNIRNNSLRISDVERSLIKIKERLKKEREQCNFADKIPPITEIVGKNDNVSLNNVKKDNVTKKKTGAKKLTEVALDKVHPLPKTKTKDDSFSADNTTKTQTNIDYELYYKKALKAYMNRDYVTSEKMFEAFVEKYKDNNLTDNALFWLGHCYLHLGKNKKAIETFKTLLNEYPYGSVLTGGKTDAALYDLIKIYSYDKKMSDYYRNILLKRFPTSKYAKIAKKIEGG